MTYHESVLLGAALAATAIFSGGCRSDAYYQNRAVGRAREYLLDKALELSAEEKYFITFNDPVFLTAPIMGNNQFVKARSVDSPVLTDQLNQVCVAWKLPQRHEWYLVYGASSGRMDYWYPERLIRKKFAPPKVGGLETATDLSRTYAKNNLFHLMNVDEQNFIRFHFPALYETNYELNFNPTGDADDKTIAKERAFAEKSIQYSLVWEIPGDKDIAIFCGPGGPELASWKINFAGKTSADELRRHTVRRIKTPEEFYRAFQGKYAQPEPPAGKEKK